MGYGPPPAGDGPQSQQPPPNMQSGPVSPGAPFAPPPRRTSRLAVVLAVVAILLAGAALVVSLVRKPETPVTAQPTPTPTTTASTQAQQIFVDDADRSLCQAIAPLMKESDEHAREFAAYSNNSPEQKAALSRYRAFTEDWAKRIQAVLNGYADPPRYLTRVLQRFIDDTLLYAGVDSVGDEIGVNTWKMSLSDYGGPLGRCRSLGVNW